MSYLLVHAATCVDGDVQAFNNTSIILWTCFVSCLVRVTLCRGPFLKDTGLDHEQVWRHVSAEGEITEPGCLA